MYVSWCVDPRASCDVQNACGLLVLGCCLCYVTAFARLQKLTLFLAAILGFMDFHGFSFSPFSAFHSPPARMSNSETFDVVTLHFYYDCVTFAGQPPSGFVILVCRSY